MNKIIKAYRIFRQKQAKLHTINYTTNLNTSSNLNTNIYPNKNIHNDYTNNINRDNTNNEKTNAEDLDENLNIDNSISKNNDYLIHNENNNEYISQEQYVTEQSYSSQSFTKTINFIGEKDSDGLKKGFGIEKRGDGTLFKGIYKNDKLDGWGIQIRESGIYKGEFEEGRTCGYGIYTMKKNGASYYGEWMDDMLFGCGFEIWKDSKYEGEYNNGVKNGFGSYIVDGHVMYCGEWYNNNIEGFGIYTYFDGTMVSLPLYRNLFHNKYFIMREDFDSIGYYIVGYDDKNQGFVEKKQYNDIAICVWRIPLTHLDTIAQLVVNLYNDLSKKKTSKNM